MVSLAALHQLPLVLGHWDSNKGTHLLLELGVTEGFIAGTEPLRIRP